MSPTRTQHACDIAAASELRPWTIPLITEQVADLTDPIAFPEIHLAREHARRLREQEARNG